MSERKASQETPQATESGQSAEKAAVGVRTPERGGEGRRTIDASMSEADWQRQVVQCAEANGWTCWHDNDARRNDSGFPDLMLIRDRVIFAELKRDGKEPTRVQRWFHDLLRAAGAEIFVWHPSDWPEAEAVLKGE